MTQPLPARQPSLPSSPLQPFPDLIPGILTYGSLNLLAGASGVGKTCLVSWLLAELQAGRPVFGHPTTPPAAIGYLCADRGLRTSQYWFDKHGTQITTIYTPVEDLLFDPARLRNKFKLVAILEQFLRAMNLPPGSLIVVDPLALFLGGNINDYMSCAVACIEIRRVCQKLQLTLLGTAHAAKQKSDSKTQYQRLQDRILGSAAQLGYADTQMYLASPEETGEKFFTFLWHSHTAPAEVFPLGRDQEGRFIPWAESAISQEEGKILAAMSTDPDGTSFMDLVLKSEVSRATVHRYLLSLIKEGRVTRVGHGRYRKLQPS